MKVGLDINNDTQRHADIMCLEENIQKKEEDQRDEQNAYGPHSI